MTRALLLCPEPLGHRQPAGVGIRFLEMARVLLADGHLVTLLSPDAGEVAGCRTDAITPESLHRCSSESDVAVVQGHVANDFFAHGSPIPTVIDLYDPFIIENLHYYPTRGAEVFTHDHATLMQSLLRGDLFLCASEAQRLFYLGALLAVGRVNPIAFENDPHFEGLIRIAPFGVGAATNRVAPAASPATFGRSGVHEDAGEAAGATRLAADDTRQPAGDTLQAAGFTPHVLFGGIYDWYDPVLAIDAVAIARESIPEVTLTFTTHPNPSLTPQGKLADAIEHARHNRFDFVRFEPWIAYEQRAAFYGRFGAALLTFPQSIETDLSMRTRVYDYLWGGLPIVTSSAPGTDEILTRYGAGEIVRSTSAEDFGAALVRVLRDSTGIREGIRRFVEKHQWSLALQPLVDFVRAPHFAQKEAFAATMHVPERSRSFFTRIKRRIGGSS